MSKIEQLIAELCPNGVEYKAIGEVFTWLRGMTGVRQKWAESGNCQFLDYMNAYRNIKTDVTALNWATVKDLNQINLRVGDILFTAASETPDECALASEIEDDLPNGIFMDDHLFGLRTKQKYQDGIAKGFLKYWFRAASFRKEINKTVRGVTRFYISQKDFVQLKFPVPPLEVQREIVRVLDSFTSLSAELSARKKQYEYYRDSLLSFHEQIERYPLEELADFKNGKGHEKAISGRGKYVVVNSKFISTNGKVRKYTDEQICPLYVDDILMVMSDLPNGRALAKCFLVDKDATYSLNQRIGAFHVKSPKVSTKFLLHVLNRNKQLLKFDNGVDQTNLKKSDILEISIPIPPLEMQREIVRVLDNFNAICSDLSAGLPAEIEARKKQYEYYRDKLLTFKELKIV